MRNEGSILSLLEVLLRRFIGIIDRISKETIDITSPYVPR